MKPLPPRPISGGTADGHRPTRYHYWRTGYGESIFSDLDFYLVQAGEYHCKPHDQTGSFEHIEHSQFFYHLAGEASLEYPDCRLSLSPGDVFILPPRNKFSYSSPKGMKYHWFALDGRWPQFLGNPAPLHFPIAADLEIENFFIELRELLILRKPGYPLRAIGVFYELMARLEEIAGSSTAPESTYPEAVRNAIIYLRENYASPFNAADTAAAVGLSPSHLRALFEKWLRESPKRYHTHHRIQQAKRMLSEQNLRVAEVGFHVGFAEVHHFSRVFKQITGVAPSHFADRMHGPKPDQK